jgi:hypothetical protein
MNDASQGEASGFGFTQARSYDGFRLAGVRRARKYERQRAFLNLVLIFYQRGRRHTGRVLLLAIQVATRLLLSTAVRVGHDCAWRCHQHAASTQRWLIYIHHTYFQTFDSSLCTEVCSINGRTRYALDHVSLKSHNRGGSLNTIPHDHP